jgi:hypothetical protein
VNWLNDLLGPGGPQAKKAAYLFVVFGGMFCLYVDMVIELTLSASWVTVYGMLLAAVTGGYIKGKMIDKEPR